jgi:peptidoglycan/LPS O-acetylase OafA/YrhL
VCYHAERRFVPGGFVGVDVFFVISGFLISGILFRDFAIPGTRGLSVIASFYQRRITRIFPALILVLVTFLSLGYLLLLPKDLMYFAREAEAACGFYINFLLARNTGYFNAENTSHHLLHLWSLSVEEQFYLFWPLIIWFAVRVRLNLFLTAIFLSLGSLVWTLSKPPEVDAAAFFLPQFRIWELLAGALAAHWVASDKNDIPSPFWKQSWAPFLGCSLVIGSVLFIHGHQGFPNALTLIPVVGATIIVSSSGQCWFNKVLLSNRLIVWIGLISYPLYLWHWPILTFCEITVGDQKGYRILAVALSIIAAALTYALVEKPIQLRRHLSRTLFLLTLSMVGVVGACVQIYRMQGYPNRFPQFIRAVSSYNYDMAGAWRQGRFFLLPNNLSSGFASDDVDLVASKPSILLWGDSHAASLYPGIDSVYGARFNILQRTISGQPPFVQESLDNDPQMPVLRKEITDTIIQVRPQIVILAANWISYGWQGLDATIVELKSFGIRRIVVVGPLPEWYGSLPQQIVNYLRTHPRSQVPDRLSRGQRTETRKLDAQMRVFCHRMGVQYISPCDLLSDNGGYITRLSSFPDSLITWDYAHLTIKGSVYLVSHFPPIE